jgi:hypothetical protein
MYYAEEFVEELPDIEPSTSKTASVQETEEEENTQDMEGRTWTRRTQWGMGQQRNSAGKI